ncbi:MAG: aspartate/glutamate racemase family protein [Solirubrobacteraceae bacterium]|nr:aspartate/glutamate racemase family protein [Solirubrobacteraceae bacterium]
MLIKVINANATDSMTEIIGESARAVAGPGVTIDAVSNATGPLSIEGHEDEAMCLPGLLAEVRAGEAAGVDAYVIACFSDPGLLAAREIAAGPVVGIAEAAMRAAAYLGRGFSVITTLERSAPHTRHLAEVYGLERHCHGVHATGIAVLELETDPEAYEKMLAKSREALAADRSDVIVLGCAGMADLCRRLSADLGVPVVDGVAAATVMARSLVDLGLSTSKYGEFSPPPPKTAPV